MSTSKKEKRPNPNKALKYKRLTYDSFFQDGVMTIDKDVVKHTKLVTLTALQAKTLNSQSGNSGVEYVEVNKGGRPPEPPVE